METLEKAQLAIYTKMAALCSRAEQCSPDIRKKITDLGGDEVMVTEVLQKLQEEHYLNDERYSRAYVRDKFRFNKWGRIKIRYYLKQKGLANSIIDKGFEEIEDAQYKELLISTMKEKAKTLKNKEKFQKMASIVRFAQSRGFEPELIHRYMGMVLE